MLDTLPASASLTRTRVEARILDIPIDPDDLKLEVQPRQSSAAPIAVSVIERISEAHSPGDSLSSRGLPDGHKPIVRLRVQRFTKLNQKARNATVWFDIQGLRAMIEHPGRRPFHGSHAWNTFTPETVTDLVRLSDRALELYAAVDWAALEMNPEAQ